MSTNPFGALNDDSDDESPAVVTQTRTTTAPKAASKPMTKTAQKKAAQAKKAAEAAKAVAAANANAKSTANSNGADYNGKEKVNSRTGGRDTHGRNASGPGRVVRDKREFDRRSGTGRGKDVKKNGAGAHNWGEPGTDAAVEGEEATPAVEGEAVEEVEVVPEIVQLTMEEYEAVRAAKRTGEGFGAVKASKAVEAVAGDRYVKETNVQDGFMQFGDAKAKRVRDRKSTKSRFTDVAFKIKSSDAPPPEREERRGGGDRGGRGGSRGGSRGGREGGEGRGGFRGGRGGGAGGREGGREGGNREGGGFRGGRGGARGGARGGRGGARGGAAGPGPVGAGRPAPTGPRGAINPNDASAFPALGA